MSQKTTKTAYINELEKKLNIYNETLQSLKKGELTQDYVVMKMEKEELKQQVNELTSQFNQMEIAKLPDNLVKMEGKLKELERTLVEQQKALTEIKQYVEKFTEQLQTTEEDRKTSTKQSDYRLLQNMLKHSNRIEPLISEENDRPEMLKKNPKEYSKMYKKIRKGTSGTLRNAAKTNKGYKNKK
ncbi:hypothetical protein HXZ66_13500 [Bacillus sp. A116_S68]|nr:hypothetical protein HXZ66_13500 [Bacillus sp. A116_S68]